MKFIGDFHLHSHYSLATSKELRPDFLDYWARLKGIKVIGTGDFTHPGWLQELREQLESTQDGLFRLKPENKKKISFAAEDDVRFMLTAEISCIYKKKGKVRKVHNLIFAPSFHIAEKIQNKLITLGFNITSDGRPIIGLDSRDLLEVCLDSSEDIFFIPAHIWTPWFSVLGSESGFDSVNECFEDLSQHITAVEMGLSTDPPMNWMCSFIDKYTLTANSDAHSPEKMGRNANILDTELSYYGVIDSLKSGDKNRFLGTIDFFPQEGKYHFDGHRKCGIRWSPLETLQNNGICPVCNKKITIGVMNRIAQLADRNNILEREKRYPFYSLIPLKEILSELEGVSPDSNKVDQHYHQLIHKAGSEFNLLLHFDIDQVNKIGGDHLCEAIRRMRSREVIIQEGYDGEFGLIKVFKEGEAKHLVKFGSLFEEPENRYTTGTLPHQLLSFDLGAYRKLKQLKSGVEAEELRISKQDIVNREKLTDLNAEQTEASRHFVGPAIILAGPGTGKTQVLTCRIAYLVREKLIDPASILAITFTNKASREMKERLSQLLDNQALNDLKINTFHAFGFSIIKEHLADSGLEKNFTIINEDDKEQILSDLNVVRSNIHETSEKISEIKQAFISESDITDTSIREIFDRYNRILKQLNAFDFDDLVSLPVQFFTENPDFLSNYRRKIEWILVDEYQDVNLLQYMLIRLLMPGLESNLFVIGDPDQSIYGFRGADVHYIQKFRDDYKNASTYILKKSYRCSDFILKASGSILNAPQKFLTGIQKGVKINISENITDKSEAEFIARTIERMIGGVGFFSIDSQIADNIRFEGIESFSDFAVLCRISRLMPPIEKALKDHNIPYQKVGEESVLRQEPVKSLLDVYRFFSNPENSFLKSQIQKQKLLNENKITQIFENIEGKNLSEKLEIIINSVFHNAFPDNKLMFAPLIDLAKQYEGNEEDFLQDLLYGTAIDIWKPKTEAVNLMTMHASKGLEFSCVFIAGCEDNLIPYTLREKKNVDPEEERRLLYVGMTRAKNYLYLTNAQRRYLMGTEYYQKRSYFLDQIENELIEKKSHQIKIKEKRDQDQLKLF